MEYLERNPIIDIKKTSEELGNSFNAVLNAVNNLVMLGTQSQKDSSK
jgi:hypothetical protein